MEMFFIRKGSVEIRRHRRESLLLMKVHSDHPRRMDRTLSAGSSFGEIPMLKRQPYKEDVIANEPCEILALTFSELAQVASVFPNFRSIFAKNARALLAQARSLRSSLGPSGFREVLTPKEVVTEVCSVSGTNLHKGIKLGSNDAARQTNMCHARLWLAAGTAFSCTHAVDVLRQGVSCSWL